MRVRFWGARGSVAAGLTNAGLRFKLEAAIQQALDVTPRDPINVSDVIDNLPWYVRQTAGGDTACVELQIGDDIVVLDAGTGIRPLGLELLRRADRQPLHIHLLISHTHWDHISGLPFFAPAAAGSTVTIYSPIDDLRSRLEQQQSAQFFPLPLSPNIQFVQLTTDRPHFIGDTAVHSFALNHPGGSYGYRLENDQEVLVYATDAEYQDLSPESIRPCIEFFEDADMLIFDAQYTMIENIEKENWGHSNVFSGIDMAIEAGVKRLVFTHHDPNYGDEKLWRILMKAKEYLAINRPQSALQLYLAHEGLNMKI